VVAGTPGLHYKLSGEKDLSSWHSFLRAFFVGHPKVLIGIGFVFPDISGVMGRSIRKIVEVSTYRLLSPVVSFLPSVRVDLVFFPSTPFIGGS